MFLGAVTSNIGTWIETVTVGIYLQSQTDDARYVAAGAAAAYIPHALMGFVSGSVADRFDRRKILIFNNICAGTIATFLALSIEKNIASPALVISCVFLTGFLNAMSFPTWQAFLSDIVPHDKVPGALSLMFAQWNLGRIVGPAIAAVLLAGEHYTIALGANAISFFIVATVVLLVRTAHYQQQAVVPEAEKVSSSLTAGWRYLFSEASGMRSSFFVYTAAIFFSSPFIALIPNIADDVFGSRSLGTSLLTTFQGIGAVIIAVTMTTLHIKFGATRTQQAFIAGLPLVLILFAISPNIVWATPIALLYGATYLGTLTSTTLACQLAAPPNLKGRISAAYMATLGLLFPISSMAAGFLVSSFGAREYFAGTSICLAIVICFSGALTKSYKLPSPYSLGPDVKETQ